MLNKLKNYFKQNNALLYVYTIISITVILFDFLFIFVLKKRLYWVMTNGFNIIFSIKNGLI